MTDKDIAKLVITVLEQVEQVGSFSDLVPIIRTAAGTLKDYLLKDADFSAMLNKGE